MIKFVSFPLQTPAGIGAIKNLTSLIGMCLIDPKVIEAKCQCFMMRSTSIKIQRFGMIARGFDI